uniref:Putative secreted peptide n=1 Tax=Anopheles braziliensis TaxID=58242 RepID=A0A2M3ZR94_9DIPT
MTRLRPLMSYRFIFSSAIWTCSGFSNSTIPQPRGLLFSSWKSSTNDTSPTSLRKRSFKSCHRYSYGTFDT